MDAAGTPMAGWYGKLPALGDFASRRLAPDFLEAWDGWLAAGLGAWRENDPEGWLAAYLAGPSWRFVLLPGALPTDATTGTMAGILLPSVDRVGRYFPFTLAWPLAAPPGSQAELDTLLRRLHEFDDLALDALNEDWSVDQLEQALERLPLEPATETPSSADLVEAVSGMASHIAGLARASLLQRWSGCAVWLSDPAGTRPRLHVTQGLPQGADFIALLSGEAGTTPGRSPPDPAEAG